MAGGVRGVESGFEEEGSEGARGPGGVGGPASGNVSQPRSGSPFPCASEVVGRSDPKPRSLGGDGDESEVADLVIARLVRRGVVTAADLVAAKVSPQEIKLRVRNQRLIPVFRGIYFVGHPDPAELALEYAALKVGGDTAAISQRPAAVLWGSLPPQVDATIHITLDAKRKDREGLTFHTAKLHPDEVHTIHGDIRVTSPARTILDIAPTLDDDQLERVVGDAIRRKLVKPGEFERLLARHPRQRGTRRLKAVLALEGGPLWDASKAEREIIKLIRAAELPLPESNHRTGSSSPDLVWREQRLMVEIDGFAFHGDRLAFERDRALDAERTADGWRTLRFTWRRLRDRPLYVVARLAATLARAG